ncbi:MAG: TIGR01841 family phasin [Gammaproteobacteria bacterium]
MNIDEITTNIKAESGLMADRALAGLRQATMNTAGLLNRTKAPARALIETGLKFNAVSHKGIEKLLKQQLSTYEDLVDGSTRRLQMAARAKTLRALWNDQVAALPDARDTVIGNARKTAQIVRATGDDVGDILRHAAEEAPAKVTGTARKAGTRKTSARKTSTRRAPRKAAARKTTGRKTGARRASAKKKTASRKAS